jgi:hypothetical protein
MAYGGSFSARAVALSVALALVLVAACTPHPNGNSGQPPEPPLRQAIATIAATGISFTADVTVTGWNNWTMHGSGETAPDAKPAMAMDMPGMELQPHWLYDGTGLKIILVDDLLYVAAVSLSGSDAGRSLVDGAQWARIDLTASTADSLGLRMVVGQATVYTPTRLLQMMLAANDLHAAGSESLNGTDTTRYDATASLDDILRLPDFDQDAQQFIRSFFLVAQADQASFSVWLDKSGNAHKVTWTMTSDLGRLDLVEVLGPANGIAEPASQDVKDMPVI